MTLTSKHPSSSGDDTHTQSNILINKGVFYDNKLRLVLYFRKGGILLGYIQGVTKRCRLSWLTNRGLVFEPKCGGGRGLSE